MLLSRRRLPLRDKVYPRTFFRMRGVRESNEGGQSVYHAATLPRCGVWPHYPTDPEGLLTENFMGRIATSRVESEGPAAGIFRQALVWDNHTCTTLTPAHSEWMAHLPRHRDVGFDVGCVYVGFDVAPPTDALLLLAEFRNWVKAHSTNYALLERSHDIEQVCRAGKLGVCFNLEGGNALLGSIDMVSLYYDLGVRWMLFAYNKTNSLCGGCLDEDTGLTEFGRSVMNEMERVG